MLEQAVSITCVYMGRVLAQSKCN